jgi:hemerythrin-like domain-containing protein
MAVQIGAKPDSGFEDPIGMLIDCHRRIEHFLDILCVVAGRAQSRSLTDEERVAVQSALQYFRTGGQRHTADEEESLFPRLRKETQCTESSPRGMEEITRLESDHHDANNLHEAVDRLYSEWISTGMLKPEDGKTLVSETERLKHLYSEHIQIEEIIVFPYAARVLGNQAIAAIGAEFSERRK